MHEKKYVIIDTLQFVSHVFVLLVPSGVIVVEATSSTSATSSLFLPLLAQTSILPASRRRHKKPKTKSSSLSIFEKYPDSSLSSSSKISLLQQFIKARCTSSYSDLENRNNHSDNGGTSIWLYDGILIDPLTNQPIANVEGLEIIRRIASFSSSSNNKTKFLEQYYRRCRSLQINKIVQHIQNHRDDTNLQIANHFNYETFLTRKMFLYKPLQSSVNVEQNVVDSEKATKVPKTTVSNDHKQPYYTSFLLQKWKRRPTGPSVHIPLDQSIQVYDSITTVIEKEQQEYRKEEDNTQGKDTDDGVSTSNVNREWIMFTEYPDGTIVQSPAVILPRRGGNHQQPDDNVNGFQQQRHTGGGIQFTTYAKRRRPSNRIEDLIPTLALTSNAKKSAPTTSTQNHRRSALVQFGSSSSSDLELSRYGSRETYIYQWSKKQQAVAATPTAVKSNGYNNNDIHDDFACTLQYSRYGEGPVWYGPGRMCLLELKGRKLIPTTTAANTNDNNDNKNKNRSLLSSIQWRRKSTTKIKTKTTNQKNICSNGRRPPTIAQTIAAHVPKFWDYYDTSASSSSSSSITTAMIDTTSAAIGSGGDKSKNSGSYQTKLRTNDLKTTFLDDDTMYTYYSDPLVQIALLQSPTVTASEKTFVQPSTSSSTSTVLTAQEFRDLFHDLQIGRIVSKFRTNPMNLLDLARSSTSTVIPSDMKGVLLPVHYSFVGAKNEYKYNEQRFLRTKGIILNFVQQSFLRLQNRIVEGVDVFRYWTSFSL